MFLEHTVLAHSRMSGLLKAAEAAVRAIPPAFPLDATVAVNPFLGQRGEDLATASARLARVAGIRLTRPRSDLAADVQAGRIADEDLAAALADCDSPLRPASVAALRLLLESEGPAPQPLPTIADLAAGAMGIDWPAVIARTVGLWAGGHFDRGQAIWTPAPGQTAFASWREWASRDLTPEIAGLTGFCAHVASLPDTPEQAILRAAERLGITEAAAETAFHRLLMDLGGWAQHARYLLWQAELEGQTHSAGISLLAIRLVWEEALFARLPGCSTAWKEIVDAHAEPVTPTPDQVADAILQNAAEKAAQRRLASLLTGPRPASGRPTLQAAFCIDVRSEVFRRALESLDPGIETIGFAGFFGLPVAHTPHGTDTMEAHLPVLLKPALASTSHAAPAAEQAGRIAARASRAWGRFRQAAVSSFAFVEAAGPLYAWKLAKDALGLGSHQHGPEPAPRFTPLPDAAAKAATAAAVLKAMSLTTGLAPLVLLLGHGASMTNNPHESAYHCGACGGHTGEVSARLLAWLLNDPETRRELGTHGIDVPDDTIFVAGLHDTTTDTVTLFPADRSADAVPGLGQARNWLARAGAMARAERAPRLAGGSSRALLGRASDWAEVRPEWGLAGCSSFIAAPRAVTAGRDLGGRTFLHTYDWTADADFATLELILTAPVVVASWINLQYYGSTVAPSVFGSGNKLIHNVVGGFGVLQGNGGVLRTGLPWQAVHDGERLVHEPLRLQVAIEAPPAAMTAVLGRHSDVRALFDNGWLSLFALEQGRVIARYRPGLVWEESAGRRCAAA